MNLYLDCSYKAPSHTAVLLWVKKYGLYQLSKPHQKTDDWIVILDESVQFGQNKLLLVYGIRKDDIEFNRSLTFSDLTPLVLISRSSWTGDLIARQLEELERSIGKIRYAVADQGNSIRKALKIRGIFHVYDITHCISLLVEHIYKDDQEFVGYTKQLAHLRGSQALGKMSHLLPPAQRSVSRFMNLRPISDWGMAVLNLLENGPESFQKEKENLGWTLQYRDLINELAHLTKMINEVQFILKTKGLCTDTFGECKKVLVGSNSPRISLFKEKLMEHLQKTIGDNPGGHSENLLCCSDIIESAFGKYKNYLQANPMVGITNLSLSLAAFTGKLTKDELMEALQSTDVARVQKWTQENIGRTTLSKRLEALKWNRNSVRNYKQI